MNQPPLRLQAGCGPGRRGIEVLPRLKISRPAGAIMDAKFALYPELDGLHVQAIAAPVRRPGDLCGDLPRLHGARAAVGNTEATGGRGDRLDESGARGYRLALLAGPGADAALPGTQAKVGVV